MVRSLSIAALIGIAWITPGNALAPEATGTNATDPTGPETGGDRIPGGGSWNSTAKGVRPSNRNLNPPGNPDCNIGFRAVRERVR